MKKKILLSHNNLGDWNRGSFKTTFLRIGPIARCSRKNALVSVVCFERLSLYHNSVHEILRGREICKSSRRKRKLRYL